MSLLHVVVLAAGQGTRMRSKHPKVLHALAGRPLLQHVIDTAEQLSPTCIHVVHGHGGNEVQKAFDQQSLEWVEQRERKGTGHAVQQATPNIPDDAVVLVLYGDVPLTSPATLQAAVNCCVKDSGVGLITVELPDPQGYGRILRTEGKRVTGIVEEKDASPAERKITEVNTGIVAAAAKDLKRWLAALDSDNAQGELYLTDVIGMAASERITVKTVHPNAPEEVAGVNDRRQLAALERWYQRQLVDDLMLSGVSVADPNRLDLRGTISVAADVYLDLNVILEGRVTICEGARIGPNVVIRDSVIGPDTIVHANCVVDSAELGAGCTIGPFARLRPGAVLEDGVHVGNYVEVKNSRLGVGSKANHLTYLGDADIGRNVNVGAGTITCNYDGANKHRTIIGDGAFIGSGVELVAPITVREGATIGAGSTLSKDAPPGELTFSRSKARTVTGWKRPVKQPK